MVDTTWRHIRGPQGTLGHGKDLSRKTEVVHMGALSGSVSNHLPVVRVYLSYHKKSLNLRTGRRFCSWRSKKDGDTLGLNGILTFSTSGCGYSETTCSSFSCVVYPAGLIHLRRHTFAPAALRSTSPGSPSHFHSFRCSQSARRRGTMAATAEDPRLRLRHR